MNHETFCYWLQGFFELSGNKKLTQKQVQIIKDHLALVFTKVTPDRSKDDSAYSEESLEKLMKKLGMPMEHHGLPPAAPFPINPNITRIPVPTWPGLDPLNPFIVTCSAEPKIPDSRPDCSSFTLPDGIKDEVIC